MDNKQIILGLTFLCMLYANSQDYCAMQSCSEARSHTMCKYPESKPAAACGKVYTVGLSDTAKAVIVDTHNELRNNIAMGQETRGNPGPQPPASNMRQMVHPDIKPEDIESLTSLGYCGVQDGKIPDGKPMGYPFDRPIVSPENFFTSNMKVTDVLITNVK